jgi:AcrR family transcriptional regulator
VSQAAPYHYFTDKSALLAAVATEGFELFDRSQAAAIANAPADPDERLAALGAAYIRFALDRPHYFRVMFRPHLVEHERYPALKAVADRAFERLVDAVRKARLAHGHDDTDVVATATLIWAVPHGLAALYLDGPTSSWLTPRALELLAQAATAPLTTAPLAEVALGEPNWGV